MCATWSGITLSLALLAQSSVPPVATVSAAIPQSATAPAVQPTTASASAALLTDEQIEQFLKQGRVVRTRGTEKGITGSVHATMSKDGLTHDAHIQTIDEFKREFRTQKGIEFDFRDSWMFNVAAYKLDRLLDLHLVPVSVAGNYRSSRAAVTWWVDDVMMDEGGRLKKKLEPPADRVRYWNQQIYMMRLFDELIYNTDRNLGNMLISSEWRLWAIDHTRAFRKQSTLKSPAQVTRCDRRVFEKLKALDLPTLKRELGPYLDEGQMKAILARRDLIVAKVGTMGPAGLFDSETPAAAR